MTGWRGAREVKGRDIKDKKDPRDTRESGLRREEVGVEGKKQRRGHGTPCPYRGDIAANAEARDGRRILARGLKPTLQVLAQGT